MRFVTVKTLLVVWALFLVVYSFYFYNQYYSDDEDKLKLDGYSTEGTNIDRPIISKKGMVRSRGDKKTNKSINRQNKKQTGYYRKTDRSKERIIEVLRWTEYGPFKRDGPETFSKCEYKSCTFTSNLSRIDDVDAVVMTAYEFSVRGFKLPKYHLPWQRWVFLAMEPPVKVRITSKYNNVFNVTATFRDDADVHFKYLQTVPLPPRELNQVIRKENYAAGKSRLVAWMVSHCDALNRRLDYVRELQKYITVDIYGQCGPYKCGDKYGWVECRTMLDISYKFYLAFENGFCPGYLTEKIWAALTGNVLPVVMGGADYSKYLPPNSYLDVRNFSSPEKLAEYMKRLDRDDALYNRYFEWKTSYKLLEERDSPHWCELCKYMHTVDEASTYPNLDKWYNDCIEPNDYYKGVADMLVQKQ